MPGGSDLRSEVLDASLCALCGTCLDWCPYIKNLEDRIAMPFDCMITDGRCYSVCPRTLTDWQKIRDEALGETPYNGEVGRYHSVFKVRSTVSFNGQQDGGTVSGLLLTALEENMAGAALVTGSGEDRLTPSPILGNIDAVKRAAGSRFLSSPGMRKYR